MLKDFENLSFDYNSSYKDFECDSNGWDDEDYENEDDDRSAHSHHTNIIKRVGFINMELGESFIELNMPKIDKL